MKKNSPRYLNIGCGSTIFPKPWENLDGRDMPGVDHISGINKLPFPDNTFALVLLKNVYHKLKNGFVLLK